MALEPPEKIPAGELSKNVPWTYRTMFPNCTIKSDGGLNSIGDYYQDYHMAPEIFVSDGPLGSIVGNWVAARNGIGGIHHIAYQVESVSKTMEEWKAKGYAEFSSDEPLKCPGLTQVFTKPSSLTGVIYEFIERGTHGFCADNVRQLMESTKGL